MINPEGLRLYFWFRVEEWTPYEGGDREYFMPLYNDFLNSFGKHTLMKHT
jgi:hypothetical protein